MAMYVINYRLNRNLKYKILTDWLEGGQHEPQLVQRTAASVDFVEDTFVGLQQMMPAIGKTLVKNGNNSNS